jgi:tetratricopeptide (TPR) repeat protein
MRFGRALWLGKDFFKESAGHRAKVLKYPTFRQLWLTGTSFRIQGGYMNLNVRQLIVMLLAFSLVGPGLARAQEKDEVARRLDAGFALLEAGNYEQAQKIYEGLLKKDPTQPLVLNNLAAIMVKRGKYKLALQYLQRALPRAKGFKVAINRVCNIDSVCAACRVSDKEFGSEDLERVVKSNILMVGVAKSEKPGAK